MTEKVEISSGQVWTIANISHDLDVRVAVLSLEHVAGLSIVHVCFVGENSEDLPGHIPFSLGAFSASTLELTAIDNSIDFPNEGYEYWKQEHDANRAGVYDIQISEVLGEL